MTCKDPYLYASWDGIHLTEAAYRYIALGSILPTLVILLLPTSISKLLKPISPSQKQNKSVLCIPFL